MFTRAERFLFYLLLFSIPFQTRKILWQQEWYFNEWQTISLYGTDLLLGILLVLWALSYNGINLKKYDYFLFAFVGIAALSLINTTSLYLGLFNLAKLIEFVLF